MISGPHNLERFGSHQNHYLLPRQDTISVDFAAPEALPYPSPTIASITRVWFLFFGHPLAATTPTQATFHHLHKQASPPTPHQAHKKSVRGTLISFFLTLAKLKSPPGKALIRSFLDLVAILVNDVYNRFGWFGSLRHMIANVANMRRPSTRFNVKNPLASGPPSPTHFTDLEFIQGISQFGIYGFKAGMALTTVDNLEQISFLYPGDHDETWSRIIFTIFKLDMSSF
ncbi:hypothetical protein VNO77_19314 [Canavalia gladiata]|uniref:Uncharacterized protein n=1 Tax=Canavalia gladiata TaxID=3824 RepID=A0AAN9QPH5_CANGL